MVTITFDPFNAPLLNKSINLNTKRLALNFWTVSYMYHRQIYNQVYVISDF